MQQSNTYIILFSAALTIVLGGLLSLAATGLKPLQEAAKRLDTRKQILSAVRVLEDTDDINEIFESQIKSMVVDIEGNEVKEDAEGKPLIAEEVNIEKQYKKDPEERLYPVFMYTSKSDPEKVEAYILALYGNGLWDKIWGYISLDIDLNTVIGITMDHKGETPGLGARITEDKVQKRYKEKKLFSEIGELMGITMMKGERNDPSLFNEHQVDGMSGATITANGVNDMLKAYLEYYKAYLDKLKAEKSMVLN